MVAVIDALKRIAEDGAEHKLLCEEFNTFITKKGIFVPAAVQGDAVTMNAIDWWFNYGAETPHLAEVAKKVLSQLISSSSAERNWSTYSYVHNVKRNRMNIKTADKLVCIHSNECLKRRFLESYKEGPNYKWDIDPENSLLEESNLRLEKIRWKGLEGNNDNPTFDDAPEPPRKIQKTRK